MALSQVRSESDRMQLRNAAFIKSALLDSATRIKGLSITEQGAGVFNLDEFMNKVKNASISKNDEPV